MGAQEDPAGHLAVAEPLGHQVGDGAFGVGQAVPAEGRTVRVGPVAEPGADGAQPGSHPGRALGRAELLVEGIRLPQHGLRAALVALADPGAAGILQRGSAGTGSRVADRHPLQERGVLIDKPAGVVGGGRHVRVVRRGRGQPPRRVGQVRRPFGVAFGQRAADQQDRALRIGESGRRTGSAAGASLGLGRKRGRRLLSSFVRPHLVLAAVPCISLAEDSAQRTVPSGQTHCPGRTRRPLPIRAMRGRRSPAQAERRQERCVRNGVSR